MNEGEKIISLEILFVPLQEIVPVFIEGRSKNSR